MIYLDGLWLVVGSAHIRLSTVITFLAVFAFVAWKFRTDRKSAFYNGVIAALATLGLYEVLFNLTGGFPPFDLLPFWAVGLFVCSMVLGLLQAKNHFVWGRLPVILLSAFVIDWLIWVQVGFPFNLPSTQPLDLAAEGLNVTTKLLLPFGYAIGLRKRK